MSVDLPPGEEVQSDGSKDINKMDVLSQLGPLKSCYGSYSEQGEAAYTTFHESYVGCVDYIFHTVGLKCCGVLEVRRHGVLTNAPLL